ncbi:MAG TPA: YtxH domain-containing protein [Gemmatimonadaceae bacterium]
MMLPPAAPRRRAGTFLTGLGIGLAVGAALALLFAPQSGEETRRSLRRGGRRLRGRAADAWEDLRLELARTKRALKRRRREAAAGDDPDADGG